MNPKDPFFKAFVPKLLFVIISALFLQGCTGYYRTHYSKSVVSIQENSAKKFKNPSKNMYSFLEGESLDFTYTKLSIIEVHLQNSPSRDVNFLDCLKYEAWKRGANGIINVKQHYLSSVDSYGLEEEYISTSHSKYHTAVAVHIDIDNAFLNKYGKTTDTSYVAQVEGLLRNIEKDRESAAGGAMLLLAGLTALTIIAAEASEDAP